MEFSTLWKIREKIAVVDGRIEILRARVAPSSPRFDAAGGCGGDITATLAIALADMEAGRESLFSAYWANLVELHRVIADIPDVTTRLYFTARFCDCLSWSAIARKYSDPGHPLTEDSVKKYTQRALKRYEAEHREQGPQEAAERTMR